jgi:hypothetical protein
MGDPDLAYDIATELAARNDPGIPFWTKELPAFIKNAAGDRQTSYDILMSLLKSDAGTLPPQEVRAMRDYICTRLLNFREAAQNSLCDGL